MVILEVRGSSSGIPLFHLILFKLSVSMTLGLLMEMQLATQKTICPHTTLKLLNLGKRLSKPSGTRRDTSSVQDRSGQKLKGQKILIWLNSSKDTNNNEEKICDDQYPFQRLLQHFEDVAEEK